MDEYQFHKIANIFPLIEGEELEALADDIRQHGLKQPIILYEGQILDGRNRKTACVMAGVKPTFTEFTGTSQEAIDYVWSLNRKRRQLNSSQAAVAEVKRAALVDEYAATVAALKEQALERKRQGGREKVPTQMSEPKFYNEVIHQRAKAAGTSGTYLKDATKLFQSHPQLVEEIERGQKTITQVKRELKDAEREAKRQEAAEQIASAPTLEEALQAAKFTTICIDPPWDWGDEGDNSQLGRGDTTYGGMSHEELLALPVGDYADDDAHLYLWITNRSLPKGFSLIEQWGFRYITCLTWCKPSFGMGNYFRGSTEQVLFAVRGSLPLKRKDIGTWFQAPRGPNGHSSKPVEFYDIIESCSPGPFLEVFARSEREGWTSWGGQL